MLLYQRVNHPFFWQKKLRELPIFWAFFCPLRGLAAGGNGHHVGAPGGRVTTTTSCAATVQTMERTFRGVQPRTLGFKMIYLPYAICVLRISCIFHIYIIIYIYTIIYWLVVQFHHLEK